MIDRIIDILSYQADNPLMFNSKLFWILFMLFIPLYGWLIIRQRRIAMELYVIAFSLFFYYKASGWCTVLLIARTLIDYYLVRAMDDSPDPRLRKILLVISIVSAIGILAYFKYANFLIYNLSAIIKGNFQPLDIILPVGISFYTFQSISYTVDVYKRKAQKANSLLDYLFYLSFFPYVAAGPIMRASTFLPQIYTPKRITDDSVFSGLWLVMTGLVKKAVIADYIAQYNDMVFSNPSGYSGFECMMGVLGYSVQIFCDFSGYSDIAIGIARIMGFDLGINFRSPYKSLNITDFWHRWHISLSTWLRDYVYIPLGGNRKGKVRTYMNLMLTMLIGGIWHGAGWCFVLWGGMRGLGLIVHKAFSSRVRHFANMLCKLLSWAVTFIFVTLLWVFFRSGNFSIALNMFGKIFTDMNIEMVLPFISARMEWFIMLSVSFAAIFAPVRFYSFIETKFISSRLWIKIIVFAAVVQLILEFSGAYVSPFIYFQF